MVNRVCEYTWAMYKHLTTPTYQYDTIDEGTRLSLHPDVRPSRKPRLNQAGDRSSTHHIEWPMRLECVDGQHFSMRALFPEEPIYAVLVSLTR